jgi:homoserine O-acetyltransferase
MLKSFLVAVLAALFPATVLAQDLVPTEGNVTLRDFRFSSGEVLPELRLHYRTLGEPRRDAAGRAECGAVRRG